MFFGTARTSEHEARQRKLLWLYNKKKQTSLWHLNEEKLLALLRLGDVGGDERILSPR
jgi:hypothetical protein